MRRPARNIFTKAIHAAPKVWWAVRQIFGDAAYENYLRATRAQDASAPGSMPDASPALLSPADFYLDSLRRRYSRINRCC
jgi:hypothetical protein